MFSLAYKEKRLENEAGGLKSCMYVCIYSTVVWHKHQNQHKNGKHGCSRGCYDKISCCSILHWAAGNIVVIESAEYVQRLKFSSTFYCYCSKYTGAAVFVSCMWRHASWHSETCNWFWHLRFKFPCQLPCWSIFEQDTDSVTSPWVSPIIFSMTHAPLEFWNGSLCASPCLHHISGCYIWQAGRLAVGLLLISAPEIGSSCFPWLLLWRWQPFFHGLSSRGMLTSVFLVAVWNRRNSKKRKGGKFILCLLCAPCSLCSYTSPTGLRYGTNVTTKALEMRVEMSLLGSSSCSRCYF